MKHIVYFEIVDIGIREGMEMPINMFWALDDSLFNGFSAGIGTDAESALDDMLNNLQERDYDITGLEGQIKEGWEPSQDEGDGHSLYYHFDIVFKFTE